ncbi:MFS transporter [Actinoplanes sp. NPDC049596]|uniref:MFS transporter n=1 Tax=unclassified Actinoplanes TaxID=2626549 RepID=UPI003438346A
MTLTDYRSVRWTVAIVVLAANTMDLLDATIVNVAGPSIQRELGGSASSIQWLGAAYTLTFAVLLIAGARLGDIFGRRRMFLLGLAGFTLFSAACALGQDMGMLILFRALQGGFGALMIPQGFGMLKEVFDDEELGQATRLFGPATGLAMLGAPILAGVLIDADFWGTGWRMVFLINVPLGLIALPFALRSLPRGISHPGLKLDVGGIWLIGAALVAVVFPLIQGEGAGWPAWTFALLAVGAVLLYVFVRYERRRHTNALIEPSLFANRMYLSGVAVMLALFSAFGGLLLCVSLYGQLGQGWSPVRAGLSLTPMVIGMIGGMVVSGALVKKLGRHLLHVGIAAVGAGAVTLALLTGGSIWTLVPGLLLIGVGVGTVLGQIIQFILAAVSMNEVGSASGVMEAAQQLATALGIAVLGTVFLAVLKHHPAADALRVTSWACLLPITVAFLLVFLLPKHARAENAH